MKTLLVPTDFSTTARNAAVYAIQFARQMHSSKIVFFNAYQSPPVVDVNMAMVESVDFDLLRKSSEENLEVFKNELLPQSEGIALEILSDYGMVAVDINIVCDKVNADVIVMGVTGVGKLAETLMAVML